jgi:glyoxylase-like metal-dependent hydrolase (beta-lactamase superfamily II)
MRIANGVYVLPIPRSPQEPESFLNLTLIVDEQNGNTLVDAGLPGQDEAIGAALLEAGTGVRDLRRIIFTHQDLDHVGSGLPSYAKAVHECWHTPPMLPT